MTAHDPAVTTRRSFAGWLASLAFVAIATAAIWSTARVFSGTVDEPAHLAAGLQWLTTDRYDYDLQHPPLGRIAAAFGPFIKGASTHNEPGVFEEGARILGAGQQYVDTLASARHGEIVFFLLLAAVVWLWARRLTNDLGATLATLLLIGNPTVLAHAGLATTDISAAATTTLALLTAWWWIERPTWRRSLLLGIAIGLAICSRLSALAFLGGPLIACFLVRAWATRSWSINRAARGRDTAIAIGVAFVACVLVIWAVYRFAVGPMPSNGPTVPAPAFIAGVRNFLLHGSTGHPSFLLGTPRNHGWWYYFPIALLVKTPLPILLLSTVGAAAALRDLRVNRNWMGAVPICSAITMLAISMTVKVDIGVRLILPIFPLLAIVGAQGVLELWRQSVTPLSRAAVGLLVAATPFIAWRAHPDHLAYFNPLAGSHPERVLVDSNLDWGQDLYRLRDTIVARGIRDSVRVAYFGTADLGAAGVPNARILGLHERTTGWIAASETFLAGEWVGTAYAWLLDYPALTRIGPSMRLWYIAPAPPAATRDSLRR